MKLNKKLETEILNTYHAYWDAYLKGDMKTFASFLDNNLTVYGTADSEVFKSKKEAVKFYSETADQMTGKADFRKRRIKVKAIGNTVLVNEQSDLYVLSETEWMYYGHVRLTAIFEQKGSVWKLVHQHGSFPDSRADAGEQIAPEKIKKENHELREAIKRRTVELQFKNRELEIESSLEKVRAVAMSMGRPEDMLKVCETISLQLQKLGVKEIRNVQTAIFYPERGNYMNYEYYAKHDKSIITETTYTNNKLHKQFALRMLKGKGEIFITHIKGNKVKEWIEYQKTTNVFIDKHLNKASSLNYYWQSLGPVALGISTYVPLSKDELELFQRFIKVFELSYRRYLDIEKAEAQAREAQIEAALERVRSRAMAMHVSKELKEVAKEMRKQFSFLGQQELETCAIHLWDEASGQFEGWAAIRSPDNIGEMIESESKLTIKGIKILEESFQNYRDGKKDYILLNDYQRAKEFFYALKKVDPKTYPFFSGVMKNKKPSDVVAYWSVSDFTGGSLVMVTMKPADEKSRALLSRFANVFGLAYQRYLDIEKAEAQAREAQIQLALERVRARSLAMHNTSELQDVVNILAQQLYSMNLDINGGVWIAINDQVGKDLPLWASGGMADYVQKVNVPFLNSPIFLELRDAIKRKNNFFTEERSDKEKIKLFKHLFNYSPWNSLPQQRKEELLSRKGGYTRSVAISNFTSISITNHNGKKFSDDENKILKRFVSVFEQSYIRFLDLQKAEEQAREAKIEAALERVRAASMAMHSSKDLFNVIQKLTEQLVELNIQFDNASFSRSDERMNQNLWISTTSQPYPSDIHLAYFGHPMFDLITGNAESGVEHLNQISSKKQKSSFFKKFFKLEVLKNLPAERKKYVLNSDGYCRSIFRIKDIWLTIAKFETKPFSEIENKIFGRFAKVFEQTYTRFLDLQKAETQAREAQIEAALERVRSAAMAMRTSSEIGKLIYHLYGELTKLDAQLDRCFIMIVNPDDLGITWWLAGKEGLLNENGFFIQNNDYPSHRLYLHHWKERTKKWEYLFEGKEKEEWDRFGFSQTELENLPDLVKKDMAGVSKIYLSGSSDIFGCLVTGSFVPLSDEHQAIISRFASVFNQTYTRFLDLQKAEAQAREAKIEAALERVRSKTMAMQQSNELAETSAIVFKQLINLGIEPNRIYIAIIKDSDGYAEFWLTDEDGSKVSSGFYTNLNVNKTFKKMYAGWKENKKSITIDMHGEELQEYFNQLTKLNVPFKGGLSQKRRLQYIAYFSKGFIGVASPDETKPETIELLERFASVFNLTYTRFNDLKHAEAQNKIIQAENERKTKELEEARELQLAMLPKEIPQLRDIEIAVYMKTATEVGGDYYDFSFMNNGSLNIAIGDATGHGMKAGTMVTMIKSLFMVNSSSKEMTEFFKLTNDAIKNSNLKRMMVGFAMMNIYGSKLKVVNAGMPPVYYYKNSSFEIFEIGGHNLPLGAMNISKYTPHEIEMKKGDVILMLSDGFPELQNDKNEQYGYERLTELFLNVGSKRSDEIISALKSEFSNWAGDRELEDDITFVVIKVK